MSLVMLLTPVILAAKFLGARSDPTNRVQNRVEVPVKWGDIHHSWVCPVQKKALTRTFMSHSNTYTIFEGTSEIQRLIISRAISGVHIK